MDIALCHDNNYAPYSTVVIASILDHNENAEITFHLLHTDLTAERCAIIKSWVESFKGKKVCFYQMKKESFADFPIDEHTYLDYGAYIRLYLGECLNQIDKVLYLDCDVIVNGSLCELWNTDISDYAVAGVRDRINDYIRVYNRLGYPMSEGYINSGMMLINLKKWREDDLLGKILKAINEQKTFYFADQDLLNYVTCGRFGSLHPKWNHFVTYFGLTTGYTSDEIKEATINPMIIHMAGKDKPWSEGGGIYKQLYWNYRLRGPWPENKYNEQEKICNKALLFAKRLKHYIIKKTSNKKEEI